MALDLTRVRGLLFDIDGTLADTDELMVAQISRRLTSLQPLLFGRSPHDLARRFVMGIETPGNIIMGLPDRIGFDRPLARLTEAINRLASRGRRQRHWLMVPGAQEMLAALYPRYPMAIVSARDEDVTASFLEQHKLAGFFQAVITAHTSEHTKPYPDPVLCAAQRLNLPVEQCLMIGDTTVDVRAGRSAGAQTIAVLCGFGEEPELRRAGADLIIPNTPVLLDLLAEAH